MTRQGDYKQKIERLRAVVAAYGGDVARWPIEDQTELRAFADTEPDAQAIVLEGRSLDRLLDDAEAAVIDGQRENDAFTDKIFASIVTNDAGVREQPRAAANNVIDSNVVDLASRRRGVTGKPDADEAIVSKSGWMSVAALAASLVIGVMLGANGYLETATTGLGEIAGLGVSADNIQLEDGLGPVEEDYL